MILYIYIVNTSIMRCEKSIEKNVFCIYELVGSSFYTALQVFYDKHVCNNYRGAHLRNQPTATRADYIGAEG